MMRTEIVMCCLANYHLINAWITTDYRWTLTPVRIFKIVQLQLFDVNVSLTINSSGYPKRRDTNIQFPQPKKSLKSARSNNRVRCQIPSTPNIAADWLFIDIVCYSNDSSSRARHGEMIAMFSFFLYSKVQTASEPTQTINVVFAIFPFSFATERLSQELEKVSAARAPATIMSDTEFNYF